LQFNLNASGPEIDGVLNQFVQDVDRPLEDFNGRDLGNNVREQLVRALPVETDTGSDNDIAMTMLDPSGSHIALPESAL
jgi:hypothetical protein